MNPDAIQYYRKWLRDRPDPMPFYLTVLAIWLLSFPGLSIFLRLQIGDWSGNGLVAMAAAIEVAAGTLMICAARLGANIGAWTAFERLEAGYRVGRFRQVWYELMIKYRGLIPEIVAHERFHRLFLDVGSKIVAHEDLTAEQASWMEELLSCAKANLAAGRVSTSESKASIAKPLIVITAVLGGLAAIGAFVGLSK